MPCRHDDSTVSGQTAPASRQPDALDSAFQAITAELAVIAGGAGRVDAACRVVRSDPRAWALAPCAARFEDIARTARRMPRAFSPALLALLLDAAASSRDPWAILRWLVASGDPTICETSLARVRDLVADGRLPADEGWFDEVAAAVQDGPPSLRSREALAALRAVADAAGPALPPLPEVYLHGRTPLSRRLASRLLDLAPSLPSARLAASLLGGELAGLLDPYFAYTRASHLDLLDLALGNQDRAAHSAAFRRAEADAGAALLREVIALLGWQAVNEGLSVRRIHLVSVGGGATARRGDLAPAAALPAAERATAGPA